MNRFYAPMTGLHLYYSLSNFSLDHKNHCQPTLISPFMLDLLGYNMPLVSGKFF